MTTDNPQLALANDFLEYTDLNIFLTGKAGTGKTTFLHRLRERSPKRMVVVAPTGVAAINAGGVTINSFFQIAPGMHIPGQRIVQQGPRRFDQKMSRAKRDIIRSMELLVIDEVSMVRADMLDAVDGVLRQYRDRSRPFGGVQLLMIGDLQQLSPVVRDDEWSLLREHYATPFFFSSQSLVQSKYLSIELQQIYRQSDEHFIDLLARVRENRVDRPTLEALNARHRPGFDPASDEGYITLTSHNHAAKRLNDNKLSQLNTPAFEFEATIEKDFPESIYPIDRTLILKLGAQVMFTKNDPSPAKEYVNGTLGRVTAIEDERIEVTPLGDDRQPIVVEKAVWENFKYAIADDSKEIIQSVVGTFTHYPLKTAWAITIHKSQGLTFERAIIDAADSFSHGQVYVALSRCKSLEGLVLSSPLSSHAIINDSTVTSFNAEVSNHQPSTEQLEAFKREYLEKLMLEQFDFDSLSLKLTFLRNYQTEHLIDTYPRLIAQWDGAQESLEKDIMAVGAKFETQIRSMYACGDQRLDDRIARAATYFSEALERVVAPLLRSADVEIDNKAVRKVSSEALDKARTELRIKLATLAEIARNGFSVGGYLRTKGAASIDATPEELRTKVSKRVAVKEDPNNRQQPDSDEENSDIVNQELFDILRAWRLDQSHEQGVPAFMIFSQKVLIALANRMPRTAAEMLSIKGIGKKFVEKYGPDITSIIDDYMDGRSGAYPEDDE